MDEGIVTASGYVKESAQDGQLKITVNFALGLIFSLWSAQEDFCHLLIPIAVVFCDFPLGFPFLKHSLDSRQQRVSERVISFLHDKAP